MRTDGNTLLAGLPAATAMASFLGLLAVPGWLQADCVPPPPGLVAWWPGEGNADDLLGVHNGTLGNAAGSAGKCWAGEQIQMSIRVSQVEVCWWSIVNSTYQLQYRSTLTTNQWLPLLDCIRATNSTTCYYDPIQPGQPQRYYRAVLTNCVPP